MRPLVWLWLSLLTSSHSRCPKANIKWSKDGLPVRERDRDSGLSIVRISKNGVLTIEDNRLEDDGNYTCILENKWGAVRHTIKVQSVPRVVSAPPELIPGQPGNHSLGVGGNLTLHCQLTVSDVATPRAISWYK